MRLGWFSALQTFSPILLVAALALLLFSGCAQPASKATSGSEPGKAVIAGIKGQAEVSEGTQDWKPLFDGRTLRGWQATDFAGAGPVEVKDGQIKIHAGVMLSGIHWTNEPPKGSYEIALEAMKIAGDDFFCGLTFPAGGSHCSLILGGWGGGVVGISSIDGMDASENETTKFMSFEKNKWYDIKVRVTPKKIESWVNDEKLVDVIIDDRRISMRPGEIEMSAPLGIATYQTTTAIRSIKVRPLVIQ